MSEPAVEPVAGADDPDRLTVSFDAWEGPLDLLLALCRAQKVDLKAISILSLAEQYLLFIDGAERLRLELAADYLVMASWLAYLKSALLLPKAEQKDPDPEELALRLQLRLQRLDAMREAGARLFAGDLVGRDVFLAGRPPGLHVERQTRWRVSLFDLIQAYGGIKARNEPVVHMVAMRPVMTLDEAIRHVSALLGEAEEWTPLEAFVPPESGAPMARSALASSFVAALELARQAKAELRQDDIYAPLFLRGAA
ncbi:MAG: ScpA family protein [Sphingobium sp.]